MGSPNNYDSRQDGYSFTKGPFEVPSLRVFFEHKKQKNNNDKNSILERHNGADLKSPW